MMNKFFFLLLSLLTVLYSCKDSESFVPDLTESSVKASAFIEVVDLNGNPVPDAAIAVLHNDNGSVITDTYGTTNADGVLLLNDVDLYSSTYVTVTKPGFFKGSRRFYPTKDKTHFVHIMLMDKQNVGNFPGGTGGILSVDDKVTLEFPDVAIVDANGNDYSGTVNVLAQAIAADDENLSTKMPGDLVGLNTNSEKGKLGSLGMVAVELVTPSGEPLKVKEGSKVKMSVKVPAEHIGSAPATIPMWYFDESLGYWKEEGSAELVGNEYVTEVAHFSFWNCDAWFDLVKWGATFIYANGEPASQVTVCLTILSLNATSCSSTNEDGFVCGAVAANEVMLMEVRNPCFEVNYSQQIGPYSDTTMIGPITIPGSSVDLVQVSGLAVDCNAAPVTDGFATIKFGDLKYYQKLDEVTGAFGLTSVNCNQGDIKVTVYDVAGLKQSLTSTFPNAPVIDAGTITVCENLTELVDIEIVGFPDHVLYYFPEANVQGMITTLYTNDSTPNFKYFYVNIPGITTGTYVNTQSEIGFALPNGDQARANAVTVTITYFGDVGDYITGTVSGTFHTGPNGQGGPDYPLAGSFTILRE